MKIEVLSLGEPVSYPYLHGRRGGSYRQDYSARVVASEFAVDDHDMIIKHTLAECGCSGINIICSCGGQISEEQSWSCKKHDQYSSKESFADIHGDAYRAVYAQVVG